MKKNNFLKLFSALDLATIFYILFSSVFIVIRVSYIENAWAHFAMRATIIGVIFILLLLDQKFPNKIISLLRNIYPLFFLNYFYAETVHIKNVIFATDLDMYCSQADQWLFGCQPSMEFSKLLPSAWFKEAMFMSYFSYYLITAIVCGAIYFLKPSEARKNIFLVVFSFYLYYVVYIILPIIGPQYYFNITEYANPPYLFGKIMCSLHPMEMATGAFPSSHVGMALILSYIAFKHVRKLFFIILPFVLGICFATIYLKEHYVIDIIAGIISVPVFIRLSNFMYTKFLSFCNYNQQNNIN